jgi:uncharacterized oligopeptide transporter (OPT) family protein
MAGFLLAFVWVVLENLSKKRAPVIPMVFGIGLFLGVTLGLLLAIGGIIRYLTDRKKSGIFAAGIVLAAGIMGGEGIAGFSSKAMLVAGVPDIFSNGLLFGVFAIILIMAMLLWRRGSTVKR